MSSKIEEMQTEDMFLSAEETIEKPIEYWCSDCGIETRYAICPVCGKPTAEGVPLKVYWCNNCKTPIIHKINQIDKGICPICGKKTKYLTTDLRPVFPEERLLVEILLNKEPNEFVKQSVWAVNSRYYVDGKSISIPSTLFQTADTDAIGEKLRQYNNQNTYNPLRNMNGFFHHRLWADGGS